MSGSFQLECPFSSLRKDSKGPPELISNYICMPTGSCSASLAPHMHPRLGQAGTPCPVSLTAIYFILSHLCQEHISLLQPHFLHCIWIQGQRQLPLRWQLQASAVCS